MSHKPRPPRPSEAGSAERVPSSKPTAAEPRGGALSQVEHDTAGQQERIHKAGVRDGKARETKALRDELTNPPDDGRTKIDRDAAGQRHTAEHDAIVKASKEEARDVIAEADVRLQRGPRAPGSDQGDTQMAADKVAHDTARYEALAREHGAELSEEGFNEALRKVGQRKP